MTEFPSSPYPPKPVIAKESSSPSLNRGLVSLLLFLVVSLLIFGWDLWYVFILIAVLFIHELGHYLAMRYYNYKDVSIFFLPFLGAVTTGEKEEISQKQSAIVYLAGPVPGIVIGVVCYIVAHEYDIRWLDKVYNVFIFLNLFNLLPIMPLDGGGLVQTLFLKAKGWITKIFLGISILALVYFALNAEAWTFLLVPFFLVMQFMGILKVERIHAALDELGIQYNKTYDELSDEEYWLIRDETAKVFTGIVTPGRYVDLGREGEIFAKVRSVLDKPLIRDLGIPGKLLIVFVWLLCFVVPVIAILSVNV